VTTHDKARPDSFQPWKILDTRELFSIPNRLLVAMHTVELPDSRRIDDYLQLRLGDFVLIFAETAADEIICLRQYRHGVRQTSLELVAGGIDPGEDPATTARRELLEETGYGSTEWSLLGKAAVSVAQGIGTAHFFRARGASKLQEPCSDDLEEAILEFLTREQLIAAVHNGEVIATSHLAAIALALL
jgi:ADP-ribose pyrophosphatase